MSKQDTAIDLDLDAYSFSKAIQDRNDTEHSILYIRTDMETKKSMITVFGEYEVLIAGLFAMFNNIDGSFAMMLDAVESYAEEKEIDLENFWEPAQEQ